MVLISRLVFFCVLLVFGLHFVFEQTRKLKAIKNRVDDLYHDINSSLVTLKLTIDSLKDISLEDTDYVPIERSSLVSLVNLVEEGVSQIESSFRHWNMRN